MTQSIAAAVSQRFSAPSPPPSAGSAEERLRDVIELCNDLEAELGAADAMTPAVLGAMISLRNGLAALAGK
jgi:hypothetical protein